MPDPNAPGLVVTLSTTPQAAGGPHANLAGVFQINSVTRHHGLTRVINDWAVGMPGFFGTNKPTTLTAYLVKGTAPGIVTGHERPISNVIHETFTIGGWRGFLMPDRARMMASGLGRTAGPGGGAPPYLDGHRAVQG